MLANTLHLDTRAPAASRGWGLDIASQRKDELDRLALAHVRGRLRANEQALTAYDLGCGEGAASRWFLAAGCTVVAIDRRISNALVQLAAENPRLTVVEGDLRSVKWNELPPPDVVYSQRCLHYLRFHEAVGCLKSAAREGKCMFFVSFSGMDSELGLKYNKGPLAKRFGKLDRRIGQCHGITRPVCLYRLADAHTLAHECGLRLRRCWLSGFGNVKLVASRP